MSRFDLLVRGADVAHHDRPGTERLDIGIKDGVIAEVAPSLSVANADDSMDASGLIAFPGAVDAHQHWGIYNPLEEDAVSESRASAQGGVTTGITYMRTGQYYLNKSGPYKEFFPELMARTSGRAYVDYAFHLAPMMSSHIDEIPVIIDELGVTSFKIFMFYGSHGLHGRSNDQSSFLMIPPDERYDLAHFEFVMRGIEAARRERPDIADQISLSLHCETPEIMTAYTKMVEKSDLRGLEAYSASRPPHSEGLAVTIASYLAHETSLPTINLLHLSSEKALAAAMAMEATFTNVDFRREVTIGHLLADYESANGIGGKVNPPLRSRDDVEALWSHLLAGHIDWVSSDHACCREEKKFGDPKDDVFKAYSGFGGAEYLVPGLVSEGTRRGLDLGSMARLLSYNPAQRFGLRTKGRIEPGCDADLALLRLGDRWTVEASRSFSTQEYSPFEGMTMDARVVHTLLRGEPVLREGDIVGQPRGRYLRRPTSQYSQQPAPTGQGA